MDNASANTAAMTQLDVGLLGFKKIIHLHYRPDLTWTDFAVFHQGTTKPSDDFHYSLLFGIAVLKVYQKGKALQMASE